MQFKDLDGQLRLVIVKERCPSLLELYWFLALRTNITGLGAEVLSPLLRVPARPCFHSFHIPCRRDKCTATGPYEILRHT